MPSPPTDAQLSSLLAAPSQFTPNFSSEHSVDLQFPIQQVYEQLGQGETLEKSVRLSDLCKEFKLLQRDEVELSEGASLDQLDCRHLTAVQDSPAQGRRKLPRQFFLLQEGVPILPLGLYDHIVTIAGSLTSDRERRMCLYESSASGGILIWKWRVFEEIGEGARGTRVREVIKGKCGKWLRGVVEKETRRAHQAHMDQYHTLFESDKE